MERLLGSAVSSLIGGFVGRRRRLSVLLISSGRRITASGSEFKREN